MRGLIRSNEGIAQAAEPQARTGLNAAAERNRRRESTCMSVASGWPGLAWPCVCWDLISFRDLVNRVVDRVGDFRTVAGIDGKFDFHLHDRAQVPQFQEYRTLIFQ